MGQCHSLKYEQPQNNFCPIAIRISLFNFIILVNKIKLFVIIVLMIT